ncbi:MAG: 50S ribosomal protein L19 [Rickettsiales bacterium]|jgi:large subunit ribosomal protein L19|nr:50S ribosomal protein L19 [Rickettsiales bacterium]
MNLVNKVEKKEIARLLGGKKAPEFKVGDTIKVYVKIKDGEKTRNQLFEGLVIAMTGSGSAASFVVRKESYGVGVERKFPIYSPAIDRIEKVRSGQIRRAKLYFLRKLTGKKSRVREKLGLKPSPAAEQQTEE